MKPWLTLLLAVLFFCFFFLFSTSLWSNLLVSEETLFLLYQSRALTMPSMGGAATSLLVYPSLPFFGTFLFPNPVLYSALLGAVLAVVVILLVQQKVTSTSFQVLLAAAVLFSPAFLVDLVQQHVNLLFYSLLLLAALFLLRYRETSGVQNCFLMGLCLGTAVYCRWETWWVTPLFLLALVLFFREEGIGKLGSLILVTFFPLAFFSGVLFFINWVSSGNPLFFLRDSPFSYHALRGSPLPFPELHMFLRWLRSSWPALIPFLALFFHDRLRALFAAGFLFISFWVTGGIPLDTSSASLTLSLPFLFPVRSGTFFRTVFLILLLVGLALGWWRATGADSPFTVPPDQYALEYPAGKSFEYHSIQNLFPDDSVILVIDRDYHFLATWSSLSHIVVPEHRLYTFYLFNPGSLVDYLIINREREPPVSFSGFSRIWKGRFLEIFVNEHSRYLHVSGSFPFPCYKGGKYSTTGRG